MDDVHRDIHAQTLSVLSGKLQAVITIIKGVLKQPAKDIEAQAKAKTLKYAWKKGGLDKAVDDLMLWQTTADQSWFLIMRMADQGVDHALLDYNSTSISSVSSIRSAITIRGGLRAEDSTTIGRPVTGLNLPSQHLDVMHITDMMYSDGISIARQGAKIYILNRVHCLSESCPLPE